MRFKLWGRPQPWAVLWMLVQASRWCLSYYFYLQTEDIYTLLLAASVQWPRFEPTKWIWGDFYPLFLCFEMSLDSVSHQLHKYLSMTSGLRCMVKRMHNLNPLLVHTVLALGLIYSLGVKREKKVVIHDVIHIQFCWLQWTVNVLSIGQTQLQGWQIHKTSVWKYFMSDTKTNTACV